MKAERRSLVELTYARHVPQVAAFAYLLTGDRAAAHSIAKRTFERVLGRWAHLRGSDALETALLQSTYQSVRHRAGRRRVALRPEADPLWRSMLELRMRTRAALVLTHALGDYGGSNEWRAADVLECSPGAVHSLVRRGLGALARGRSPETTSQRLKAVLASEVERLDDSVMATEATVGRIRRRRAVTATGAALLVVVGCTSLVVGLAWLIGAEPTPFPEPVSADDIRPVPPAPACPFTSDMLRLRPRPALERRAARLAVRFNRALLDQRFRRVRSWSFDPGVDPDTWASTATTRGVAVTRSILAGGSELVAFTCGPDVARRTWKVVLHDINGTTTRGLATYYLAATPDGLKVWGSWEPGS